jgi:prepilin-type processing-associated H-X9-DG protein
MDWELSPDNVDPVGITGASLWPYTRSLGIYHCPSDNVVSDVQSKAGWSARVRSYSMNAMVGDAGTLSATGFNVNNPGYTQFFTMSAIPHPADIFVFLDEHPDSINDGYFLNKAVEINYATSGLNSKSIAAQWIDLPASFHNGGASFSFADGHSETHRWKLDSTKLPALPDSANLPLNLTADQDSDFMWVVGHMSVDGAAVQK